MSRACTCSRASQKTLRGFAAIRILQCSAYSRRVNADCRKRDMNENRAMGWSGGGGSVRLGNGVYECVLPDGTVVETFKSHKFAVEFLHQRGQPISPSQQAANLKTDIDELCRLFSPSQRMFLLP